MKFTADKDIGRKVKVIAWCVPGIGPGLHQHLVCGEVGTLVKIKETPTTPDGNYKVQLKGGERYNLPMTTSWTWHGLTN
jgi:Lon protease-like protein